MKLTRHFALLFLVALLPFTFAGCDKISDNGALDGMWQIMSVAYNSNYSEQDTTLTTVYDSVSDKRVYKAYLSFQLDLAKIHWLEINIEAPQTNKVLCRFERGKGTLRLYQLYWNQPDQDISITDEEAPRLSPFGIHRTDETFEVVTLTHENMVLQSRYARITLRKF